MMRSITLLLSLLLSGLSTPVLAQSGEFVDRCEPTEPDEASVDWLTHFEAKERVKWFRKNFPDKILEYYKALNAGIVTTTEQALDRFNKDMRYALGDRKLKYSAYPSFLHVEWIAGKRIYTDPLDWTAPKSVDGAAYIPPGYQWSFICYAREEGFRPLDILSALERDRLTQIIDSGDWVRDPLRDRGGVCSRPGPRPSFCR